MDRRRFLHGITAAAGLTAAAPYVGRVYAAEKSTGPGDIRNVAVIGGGIIGASIAYNLSKRGCGVRVLEKNAPASQASGNSFAWINASYFETSRSYFDLRTHSLNEYHRLSKDVDIPLRWGGSLEWYESAYLESEVVKGVRLIQSFGAPTWIINAAEATRIEPNLRIDDEPRIAWCTRDGAVDPSGTTRALLDRVVADGGEVIYPATVTGIENRPDGVRLRSDAEDFDTDLVVIAAGVDTNEFAKGIGLSVAPLREPTPGIIVTTEPLEPLVKTVVYTSDTHFHQRNDGRVVIGEKAGAPETNEHRALLTGRPNVFPTPELTEEHATRIIETARHHLPRIADAKVESVGVGWRPLPSDGLPVIGRLRSNPRVYLAVMHSGVTLAPIIGHFAAMEILDGLRVDLLSDFRYERFL